MNRPYLWVVAGPNGAGKSTIAARHGLASRIPVISPDTIAAIEGVSPLEAGKKAIAERERLLAAGADFALDTTLAGHRELAFMRRAAEQGYKVNLIFVCLKNPILCQLRVAQRVASGEHGVPPDEIARRYERSLAHLAVACQRSDRVLVLDNTGQKPRLLLSSEQGRVKYLSNNLPLWARKAIPAQWIQRTTRPSASTTIP